jgi:cell pole-organizing protein PopZ
MEEILASIRKIISEDAPEGAAPAATPESDVLELTQEIESVPVAAPAPAAQPAPAPVENDVVFQAVEEPAPASSGHDGIFSDHTRSAIDNAFASIPDEPAEPVSAPRPAPAPLAPVDGATVENVFERAVRESFEPVMQKYLGDNSAAVIERMKPLIREWMDEHFPALLEGAVRAEVERVVKARGAKR